MSVLILSQRKLTIEKAVEPSVKVSPEEHSTPNMAQISPGPIESISWRISDKMTRSQVQNTNLHLVTVHANQSGNLDFFTSASIENLHRLLQGSLVNSHVGELSEATFFELERQSNEGRLGSRGKLDESRRRVGHGCVVSLDLALGGAGEVVTYTIKEGLNSGILDCSTHEDRTKFERDCGTADSSSDFLVGGDFIHEHLFADRFVNLRKLLDKFGTLLFGKFDDVFRNVLRVDNFIAEMRVSLSMYQIIIRTPSRPGYR